LRNSERQCSPALIRLQKFLAECGVASRREAENLIRAGRVVVNGDTAVLGARVDPDSDSILFDGRPLSRDEKVYVLLNKPRGVVTSAKDTHDRTTVLDFLTGVRERVFPVGRLDMDVEGALILTNDGELAYRLTHPKYEVEKVYLAWVQGVMPPEVAMQLERGVLLEDGVTAPAKVVILNKGKHSTLIRLVLHEGRKREVKRMCAKVGHRVSTLQRIGVGDVWVKGLRPGRWRYLTHREVRNLRALTRLDGPE